MKKTKRNQGKSSFFKHTESRKHKRCAAFFSIIACFAIALKAGMFALDGWEAGRTESWMDLNGHAHTQPKSQMKASFFNHICSCIGTCQNSFSHQPISMAKPSSSIQAAAACACSNVLRLGLRQLRCRAVWYICTYLWYLIASSGTMTGFDLIVKLFTPQGSHKWRQA